MLFLNKKSIECQLRDDDILCFLHIPKTAGTTFTIILENFFDYQSILPEKLWHEIIRKNQVSFSNIRLIRGHFGYGIHRLLPKKPIYATILRDPFERAISSVEHRKRDPDQRFVKANTFLGKTLDEILETPDVKYDWNAQTDYIGIDLDVMKIIKDWDKKAIANFDFGKQLRFFREKTPPEKLVTSAKKNLSQFHFVGLAEKFQESLLLLCYTFGWRPIRDNWKLNVSPRRAHKNDLTLNQLNKVKDAISLDLKLYEFAKELFESRFSQMVHELEEKYFEEKYSKIPSNEKIHQMLEKHYEDHYNKSIVQQVSSIDYDFKSVLSGSGWYWREIPEETGRTFRWTGPENVSTIDFLLASDEDMVIHLQLLRGITPDVLDSMSLKVNDTPIDIKILYNKPDKTIFEGFIPKTALQTNNKFTRLTFEVNQTINPHKQDPKDPTDRLLGVAFNSIRIFQKRIPLESNLKVI